MPELASIQLSTGQGTDERRINLVGELRAGECVLFDPKTRTEVTVWFERGRLKLKLAGCHIEMGSRFGDRAAPEPVTTKYRTTVEQDTKMVGQVQAGLHQSNRGTMAPSGGISGQVSLSRAVSRRAVTSSTVQDSPQVVAGLDFWDFRTTSAGSTTLHDREDLRQQVYIAVTEQLCTLNINQAAQTVRVEATLQTFPSSLRTKVKARTGAGILEAIKLNTNQQRIVNLLVSKGCGPLTESGVTLASSELRRESAHKSARHSA